MSGPTRFRFCIDRGGTFTDIYAQTPNGFRVLKLLSEDPEHYDDAPREGIRRIMEEILGRPISPDKIDPTLIESIRMGTTLATNALLERQGCRCALLITRGFGDLLEIGNQNRPRLFDLKITKPSLLYDTVVEIDERVRLLPVNEPTNPHCRIGVDGRKIQILSAPDPAEIYGQLKALFETGIRSIAVAMMHSYTFADHELLIGKIAAEIGFTNISLSSQIMPMVKIVGRGDTAVVDAYLTPKIKSYIDTFQQGFDNGLEGTNLLFMRSDGGLAPASSFTGSRAILSGPAGGVVGYAKTSSEACNGAPVIGFDMGGTSTDVSRYEGSYELVHETETAGVRIQAPQLDIMTVAAGGGSRLFFRNNMFAVGPESAGAAPGPVCYRKNGYLTITDANLILGRLQPEFFPAIFGDSGNLPLDIEASRQAFMRLQDEINAQMAPADHRSIEAIALGFITVANESMVRPMREISTARGYDIADHILACFGGAAGQHGCGVARSLGISKIFIHRFGGILSAYGMGLADVVEEIQEPCSLPLEPGNISHLRNQLIGLEKRARQRLQAQDFSEQQISAKRYLNLQFAGTDTSLMIEESANLDFESTFRARHQREFGFDLTNRKILATDLRVRAVARTDSMQPPAMLPKGPPAQPTSMTRSYFDNGWQQTPVYKLEELSRDQKINGPAIIIHQTSTILVEPACLAKINNKGDLTIQVETPKSQKVSTAADPVRLSIFSNLFMSIAEQMGRTLQRTAVSTNIKERHDFSCAIFDAEGGLVANAPHQPVHLGAMGEAVRQQIKLRGPDIKEGCVLATNHPIYGGSHLPDITVITPVMQQNRPLFFVASRGHHADIGGISPGSMPPFSKRLSEEGAAIDSLKIVKNGIFQEDALRTILRQAGARAIDDNLSDLTAQIAANQRGITLLTAMIDRYGLDVIQSYMGHIQDNAELAVRALLKNLAQTSETLEAEDFLDDHSPIRVRITIDATNGNATFDFGGSGDQVPGNTNTPRAVTHSAILYTLRCLIDQEIPLNQGCLKPVTIKIREGSILAPSAAAAVVGGNVLTSQRIVDVIFKAFNAVAASQGCMNNLTFGNFRFGYYETIGGGAGAGPGWPGQSGVHTHMTNTRITDPEILEQRYPVILHRFSRRRNSGGSGRFRGGDGLIREIEFTEPLNVAILSERRVYPPYGLAGGSNGQTGRNILIGGNGEEVDLGGKNEVKVSPGDRVIIMTPGGGGYGSE